jgi:hypothetical protein
LLNDWDSSENEKTVATSPLVSSRTQLELPTQVSAWESNSDQLEKRDLRVLILYSLSRFFKEHKIRLLSCSSDSFSSELTLSGPCTTAEFVTSCHALFRGFLAGDFIGSSSHETSSLLSVVLDLRAAICFLSFLFAFCSVLLAEGVFALGFFSFFFNS